MFVTKFKIRSYLDYYVQVQRMFKKISPESLDDYRTKSVAALSYTILFAWKFVRSNPPANFATHRFETRESRVRFSAKWRRLLFRAFMIASLEFVFSVYWIIHSQIS